MTYPEPLYGLLVAFASWSPLSPEVVPVPGELVVPCYLGLTFAVLFHFREKISFLLAAAMAGRFEPELKYLLFTSLFTFLVGFPLSALSLRVSELVNVPLGMALALVPRGLLRAIDDVPEQPSIVDSLLGGIGQGLSLIGGLSRTGMVTLALLLPGHSAKKALQWSFLVAPAYFLVKLVSIGQWEQAPPMPAFIAFTSAFFGSLLMMTLLERVAERGRPFLVVFGLIPLVFYALEVIL